MKNEFIASARKRRARALELDMHDALEDLKAGVGDETELLARVTSARAALAATREEADDFACFVCGDGIDPNDLRSGGLSFTRMSRHDKTDKIVADNAVELKACETCYTTLFETMSGHSVAAEHESLKALRKR